MRLLTGTHRVEYEAALRDAAATRILEAEIELLLAELKRARSESERERQRADNAVDTLLAERGIAPVTPATVEDLRGHNVFQPRPEKVAEVEAQYAAMGFGRKP